LHALVAGDVGALEALAGDVAGAMVPYGVRAASASATAEHLHVHLQLLATKDDVVARVTAHMDDIKATRDDLLEAAGAERQHRLDDLHRLTLAWQEFVHKYKKDNARQLALRLLFKGQHDEAQRELDRMRGWGRGTRQVTDYCLVFN
jgi:hypothetical protein